MGKDLLVGSEKKLISMKQSMGIGGWNNQIGKN